MSALGQKQTLGKVRLMSALPPKADIETQSRDVRFVPKADIMRCSKRQLDQSDHRCPFLISLLGLQVGTVTPPHPNSFDQGRFWGKADMDNRDFHVWA